MSKLPPARFYSPIGGEMADVDYGYVNQHGVLFPMGHKFNGGHISTFDVVLVLCPMCRHRNTATDAVKGICGNQQCRYSAIDVLDEVESA